MHMMTIMTHGYVTCEGEMSESPRSLNKASNDEKK